MSSTRMKLADKSVSTLSTTSAQVLPVNENRNGLILYNPSATYKVAVSPSGTAAAIGGAGSITIPPGQAYVFETEVIPTNALNAVTENVSAPNLTIWEG